MTPLERLRENPDPYANWWLLEAGDKIVAPDGTEYDYAYTEMTIDYIHVRDAEGRAMSEHMTRLAREGFTIRKGKHD